MKIGALASGAQVFVGVGGVEVVRVKGAASTYIWGRGAFSRAREFNVAAANRRKSMEI